MLSLAFPFEVHNRFPKCCKTSADRTHRLLHKDVRDTECFFLLTTIDVSIIVFSIILFKQVKAIAQNKAVVLKGRHAYI